MATCDNSRGSEKPQRTNIDDLSDATLHRLMSMFDVDDLCTIVAPVCRRWHRISRHPTLWRRLQIVYRDLVQIQALFRHAPLGQLRSLLLDFQDFSGTVLMMVAQHCPLLERLTLNSCDGMSSVAIQVLAAGCPQMQKLTLKNTELPDGNYSVLASLRSIRNLSAPYTAGMKEKKVIGVDALQLIIDNCSQLESLDIEGIESIPDSVIRSLVDRRRGGLRKLRVQGDLLSDATVTTIGAECTAMSVLYVASARRLSDVSLQSIGSLRHLRKLKLNEAVLLTGDGLLRLFTKPNFSQLSLLFLSDCPAVTDAVVGAIVDCCGATLEELQLSNCHQVTDLSVIVVVSNCRRLTSLDLSGVVLLTDSPLETVADRSDVVPDLSVLFLSRCRNVHSQTLARVLRARRELLLFDADGQMFTGSSEQASILPAL